MKLGGKSVHFFVVWSFLLFGLFGCYFVLLFGRGRVVFGLFGRGPRPHPNSKKKHAPAQTAKKEHAPAQTAKKRTRTPPKQQKKTRHPPKQQKNKHTHPPKEQKKTRSEGAGACAFFFLPFGRVRVFFFCCLGGGRVFFLLFGRGRVLFLLFGRGRVFFFCCLGRGHVFFFFAIWAGDGSSLTYPSAWLVFKRPNNKRDRTAKKNTRVPNLGACHQSAPKVSFRTLACSIPETFTYFGLPSRNGS